MRQSIVIGLVAFAATISGACSDLLPPTESEQPDQILFVRGAESGPLGLKDVYRINADGTGLEKLTEFQGQYGQLDVTPDGKTVIFAEGSSCRIYTMAIDGSRRTNVTPVSCGFVPRLSPDGTRFSYERDWGIWVSNIDGSEPREVSLNLPDVPSSSCGSEGEPPKVTVRPLGWLSSSRLAFYRHICLVGYEYYAVNFDGGGLTELDFVAYGAYTSPDHSRIAFDEGPFQSSNARVSIRTVADGAVRILAEGARLPGRFSQERSPWAPDGTRIYFTTPSGHYVSDVDGINVRLLPGVTQQAGFSGWSPDGERISFVVYESPGASIYLSDAGGMTRLTIGSAYDTEAVWVPRQ